MKNAAIIIASGRDSRMGSPKAKELNELMGRNMLEYVTDAVSPLTDKADRVFVLGHHAAELAPKLPDGAAYAVQDFDLGAGTAKAAQAGLAILPPDADRILVTQADKPLLTTETISALLEAVDGDRCKAAILYADIERPDSYARIIFDGDGNVRRIALARDLMPQEEDIYSVNAGVYCFTRDVLEAGLARIESDEGIYHLSALAALLAEEGETVAAVAARDKREVLCIIDREDLAEANSSLKELNNQAQMNAGVTILDPQSTYIEGDVKIGPDTVIWPDTVLQRGTRIGAGCTILPGCRLKNAVIGDGAVIERSILENVSAAPGEHVPPFTVRRA